MGDIVRVAAQELGEKEIPGAAHNPRILQYAREAGLGWIDDDETPWCSIFVNWCAKQAGLQRSQRSSARSWLTVGTPIERPEPGDIVVFWRESPDSYKGHVGIFLGYSQDAARIYCLGGNQGNQVSISALACTYLLGFRRLAPSGLVQLPDPPLARVDTGERVRQLQDALKHASFDCGVSDGIFGARTEAAVRALQATNEALAIDGIYGHATRSYLHELLTR